MKDSPAERRKFAIARAKERAKKVAARLLGKEEFSVGKCIHCDQFIVREPKSILWKTSAGSDTCQVRRDRQDLWWSHEATG